MAGLASHGQFKELLHSYDSDVIRVHEGILTHKLKKTAHLKVNLFGWGYSRLIDIVSETKHLIQSHAGGLLHIYNTGAAAKQMTKVGWHGNIEVTASTFLLKAICQQLQLGQEARNGKFLAETLKDISVQYDLTVEDPKTKFNELRMYLNLAQYVGLVPDSNDYCYQLEQEFPKGLGQVNISYVVRYDYKEVMTAFLFSETELAAEIREIMRNYIAAKYTGMTRTDWLRPVGYAYLQKSGFQSYALPHFLNESIQVVAKLPEGKRKLRRENKQFLRLLYRSEAKYVKRLLALDKLIDEFKDEDDVSVHVEDLEQAARDFVEMAPKIDRFRDNAFFLVFDGLIRRRSGGKQGGRSAMVLEITPSGSKETVTKYLMAGHSKDC